MTQRANHLLTALTISVFVFAASLGQSFAAPSNCREIINSYFSSVEPSVPESAPASSLAMRFPEIDESLKRLLPEAVDIPLYLNDFTETHKRAPSLREFLEHSFEIRQDIHDSYEKVITKLSQTSDTDLYSLYEELRTTQDNLPKFEDFDELDLHLRQKSKEQNSGDFISSVDEPLPITKGDDGDVLFEESHYNYLKDKVTFGHYIGEYGEVLAYMRTKGKILKRGLRFNIPVEDAKDSYQKDMAQRLLLLKSNLENSDRAQLEAIVHEHGDNEKGLLRHVKEYIESTPEQEVTSDEIVSKIIQAVSNKEIDIVSVAPTGRVTWSEVKAYGRPITARILNQGGGKKKSIYDQLVEHRSVASLLGLEDHIDFSFVTPLVKVEADAREILDELGYVVFDVHDL